MEYKTRFHTHVIVGYSMYKIEAAANFFAFGVRLLHFAAQLLNAGAGDPSRPLYKINITRLHLTLAVTNLMNR